LKKKKKREGTKERESEGEGGRGEQEGGSKVGFWNVAGVKGKDGFWERIKEWDVTGLVETWVEQKDWRK